MKIQYDLLALLKAMRSEAGTLRRLSESTDLTERTLAVLLRRRTNSDLKATMRPDTEDKILAGARKLGVPTELYEWGTLVWTWDAEYWSNLEDPVGAGMKRAIRLEAVPTRFLGIDLDSCFGASAGPLTAEPSRIAYLAARGCDVNTFKTVRSRAFDPIDPPNLHQCQPSGASVLQQIETNGEVAVGVKRYDDARPWVEGMLNRFGAPSAEPKNWMEWYKRSVEEIDQFHQMLALSILGTRWEGCTEERELIQDWIRTARFGIEAGARILELNFSCPNGDPEELALYREEALLGRICASIRSECPTTQLLVKVGFQSVPAAKALVAATMAHVQGYTAVNSLPCRGIPEKSMFTEARGGLSGSPVLEAVLLTVKALRKAIGQLTSDRTGFGIVGVGGVNSAQDVLSYRDAGADVVQACTVFLDNSNFGIGVRQQLAEQHRAFLRKQETTLDRGRRTWTEALNRVSDGREAGDQRDRRLLAQVATEILFDWEDSVSAFRAEGPMRNVPTTEDWVSRIRLRYDDRIRQRR